MDNATALRQLIEAPELLVLPGAHDVLSAKLIEQAGFSAVFTSGFGLAASALGIPDVGLLTMTETLDRVKRIVDAVSIPVVADMDTGYGNPLNVVRTVQECVGLGVAGIILEDQLWPKKCGHMEGKKVIPIEEHVQKIRAAAYAREGNELVIIARTDAIAPEGFDEAIERGRAYSKAGADVIFVEAPQNIDQMKTVTSSFETPVFVNMVEGGKTPFLSALELEGLGYDMVVYPLSGLFAATRAIQAVAGHLKKTGTTDGYDAMSTFSEFEKVIGLHDYNELEARFTVGQGSE